MVGGWSAVFFLCMCEIVVIFWSWDRKVFFMIGVFFLFGAWRIEFICDDRTFEIGLVDFVVAMRVGWLESDPRHHIEFRSS